MMESATFWENNNDQWKVNHKIIICKKNCKNEIFDKYHKYYMETVRLIKNFGVCK